jgi:hypothetical protein
VWPLAGPHLASRQRLRRLLRRPACQPHRQDGSRHRRQRRRGPDLDRPAAGRRPTTPPRWPRR